MKAEIICIGTELLLGHTLDTNASFLARELAGLGIDLYHKSTVGDNLSRMVAVLKQAWDRADLLILSGGLGPTQDDLTREAVAQLIGEELEFNEAAWMEVSAYFQKIGRPAVESNRRQALFPPSGKVIVNPVGTAPALWVEKAGHIIVALPGVPRELIKIWEESIRPGLQKCLAREASPVLTSKIVRMAGIGESVMEERVIDLIRNQTNPTISPYVGRGDVILRLTAKGSSEADNMKEIEALLQKVHDRLGEYIYGYDQDDLETVVGRTMQAKGWRLALAESCTGGLISHRITNIPGSSEYYLGGVNSYSNELKMTLLGVPASTLDEFGAVSPETARAMAAGIRRITGSEVGLAVTGIAGPGGGTAIKPVGLVYLAVELPGYSRVERRVFPYDRNGNKEAAAQWGLTLLWQALITVR
ncbi:MAG TPA: competence/damage-inducible protein A [Bacillota bacterium]|nr:competence/damage-inducible protein A [Bacillota bacterium]